MWPTPATAMASARSPTTGTARDPYGAPATGRDNAAATAALVMAMTSTKVGGRLGGDRPGQVALKLVAVQEHDRVAGGGPLP